MKIKFYLFLIVLSAYNGYAQKKEILLFGKVKSGNEQMGGVNILNLNSRLGTSANDDGEFSIPVKINDTLLISSVQFERKKIVITQTLFKNEQITFILLPALNKLDEVFLHGFSGNLSVDIKKTPEDTIPKMNFTFNPKDLANFKSEFINDPTKAPNALQMTDPTFMSGVGGSATLPDYYMIAQRKLKKELKQKKEFPKRIVQELGLVYFTNTLHISEEKINHFLFYCENREIVKLYYEGNLLRVIEILKEESILYNQIKN